VPLRVDYVPGKGHTWLFGNFQLAALDAWLSDGAAGKLPSGPDETPAPEKPAPPATQPAKP
jgi:hypothetical protein